MERLIINVTKWLALGLLFFSCNNDYQNTRDFYQAFSTDKYIFAIEVNFIDQFSYLSVYTKDKRKVFEKRLSSTPLIDGVIDNKIFLIRYLPTSIDDKRAIKNYFKIDTSKLGFEIFFLITKYTYKSSGGNEGDKNWHFLKMENNVATFIDRKNNKKYYITTNKLVNRYNILSIREKINASETWTNIISSEDSNNINSYFNSFFSNKK